MANSYRIGIDIGGTGIKAGVIDTENQIVGRASRPTGADRSWQAVVQDIIGAAQDALQNANLTQEACVSLGAGCPGTIDAKTGTVVYSNNLHWKQVPLAKGLTSAFQMPVHVSNDANCAALGEVCAGAAKGFQNAILFTLGTGVGSGIILDGKIFEGGGPGGAEFGHTLLVENGEPCTCGRHGCLESYASATALIRDAKRAVQKHPESLLAALCEGDLSRMDGRIPFQAARKGDSTGKQVVDAYIRHLANGIVDAVNIFRPEMVLISGGISKEGTFLTNPLNELVKKDVFGGEDSFLPQIRAAQLGNDAGMIGAANLT
ncbi:MAG: ROK family protein [Oscillospiraceae bacterium]|jgi:glucokinase|nr:ROK family protein [Oscillospiraceae bacterium]